MTVDNLHCFLTEVQKEDLTKEEGHAVMDQSLYDFKHLTIFHRKALNLDAFFKFLFSDHNSPINNKVHHDMNAPLSHYYIHAGHNSYLTGNQLSSDCSDVLIIHALHRGVRVIELAIWPNSTKDDVEVLHGGTLTAPVALLKCFKSIKEHAFVASEYPVVITLEDHLTPDLQAKVAEMINQTFEKVLFSPPGSECLKEFPSPESLKRRIIISTKPPQEYCEAKAAAEKAAAAGSDIKRGNSLAPDEEAWGGEVPDQKKAAAENDKPHELDEEDSNEEEDVVDVESRSPQNVAPEYLCLIAIHAGKPKGGLAKCLKVDPDKVRRLSLSEQQLEKASETYGKDIVRFTQRNILRVYPKGIRVDSSNYNPMIGWSHGAQTIRILCQRCLTTSVLMWWWMEAQLTLDCGTLQDKKITTG